MTAVVNVNRKNFDQLANSLETLNDTGVISEFWANSDHSLTLYDIFCVKADLTDMVKDGNKMSEQKLDELATNAFEALYDNEEFQDELGELTKKWLERFLKGELK